MQVEYESSPALEGDNENENENGGVDPQLFDSTRVIAGEESDEDEEEQQEQQEIVEQGKAKPKRIIKQRQSLSDKQPGTTIFPLSRVKRIIKADKDVETMSAEASFMIAVATEYFIKHLMEEGYTKARLEKRKIVNYKDLAAVVARSEEFDFLKDVIPVPIPLSEALERRKQKLTSDENPSLHEDLPAAPSSHSHMNDDDLPPLVPSTNPLFPNAIVKKPPNTHAKAAQPKGHAKSGSVGTAESVTGAAPSVPAVAAAAAVAAPAGVPNTPRVVSGKNAPSTPHSLTTRGSARRSLANNDVDMSGVEQVRGAEAEGEQEERHGSEVVVSEGEGDGEDDGDGDEKMEEL